ncbi:NAD-dependent epimerase/dehydratase family protein [Halomarina oriensis]|uniref:NAD-dependent epimerase/dehydratase family protein n=1 Tax=Halomarina oriensis TaxID=671145 RepID=A0A6B0GKN2_9EURY|nr:NAD-dependent epimerase/dehydratase family protein [Halomarina oriensis]MWG35422.1 NAD-dependent epimerase/dehydratase family protein [Halomarina oriensis]
MRVVVLGAGYVGVELCRRLHPDHDVTGVRRSDAGIAAIEATGASAVRADVTDDTELSVVPDCDALVFAASSGGRGAEAAREVYVDGLRTVVEHFAERPSPPERLVYTSSTSVYGDHDGEWVDEGTPLDPQTEKAEVLVEAERVAREDAPEHGIDGTVVRFAGLYGPDRYRLERYVEGPVTQGYLNMLHRDDAAGVVEFVLDTDPDDDVVLAVDDEPVDRWSLADWLADECGVEPPEKRTVEERLDAGDLSAAAERRLRTSKRCSNDRLHELGYEFAYPTYREGYRAAVEADRADLGSTD